MSEFDVEIIGDEPGEIEERLSALGTTAQSRTNDALLETAEDVKNDLEQSSPVDTGEYKGSWYIFQVDEGEVWILNEAEHAQFVMLPNSVMVGSSEADLPASGVLHNVKGVARNHKKSLNLDISDMLEELFSEFEVS